MTLILHVRNSSHGWGSWTDRWEKSDSDISPLKNEICVKLIIN